MNGIDITTMPSYNAGMDIVGAFNEAFAACPPGGTIILPAGEMYLLSSCTLDGRPVTVYAEGATINVTGTTGGLRKTDHGNTLTVIGGRWIGESFATLIKYDAIAGGEARCELRVSGAYFRSRDAYCVELRGSREATFIQCEFETDDTPLMLPNKENEFRGAVYLHRANNPYFESCFFSGRSKGYGLLADGGGHPESANPVLSNCEVMGWEVGVKVVACDDGHLLNCTVDYNIAHNVYLSSQDVFKITGCYLGGGFDKGPATYALVITSEGNQSYGPDVSRFITVTGTHFVGHQTQGSTQDLVLITGPSSSYYSSHIVFQGCHFQLYSARAVVFSLNDGVLQIVNSTFVPRGSASEPVYNALGSGDRNVLISGCSFPDGATLSGANLARARTHNVLGFGGSGFMSRAGATNPNGGLVADRGMILAQQDGLWIKGGSDGTNTGWAQPNAVQRSYVFAHTCNQVFPSSPSNFTRVTFNVEAEDARNEWSGHTFTAAAAGDYQVNCVMAFSATGPYALNEQTRVDLFRDGFRLLAGTTSPAPTAAAVNMQSSINAVVPMVANGTLDVRVFNNCNSGGGGSNVNGSGVQFSTWITIKRIS